MTGINQDSILLLLDLLPIFFPRSISAMAYLVIFGRVLRKSMLAIAARLGRYLGG